MELWDIYDHNGIKTNSIIKRGEKIKDGFYHLASEVWIINSKSELLIQKRSSIKKTLPGIWGMTTGCMVSGEDSLTGSIREAKEEIGINLIRDNMIKINRLIHDDTIWDVYAIKQDFDLSKAILQVEEVSAVKWITIPKLKEMISMSKIFKYPEIYEIIATIENNIL